MKFSMVKMLRKEFNKLIAESQKCKSRGWQKQGQQRNKGHKFGEDNVRDKKLATVK